MAERGEVCLWWWWDVHIETAFSGTWYFFLHSNNIPKQNPASKAKQFFSMDVCKWWFETTIHFSCKDSKFIQLKKQPAGIFQVPAGDQDVFRKPGLLNPPTPQVLPHSSHDCIWAFYPTQNPFSSTRCCVFCTLGESCFSQSQPTTHDFWHKKQTKRLCSFFFFRRKTGVPNYLFRKIPGKPPPKKKPTKVRYVQEQSKKIIHAVFRGIGPFGPMGCSQLAPAVPFHRNPAVCWGPQIGLFKSPLFVGVLGWN